MAHWIWLHLLSFGPGFKSQVHYHLANRVYIEMGKLQCESFGKNLILSNWKLFYVFSKIWNLILQNSMLKNNFSFNK